MNLFSQLGGLLQQYASGANVSEGDVHGHFDQVAKSVDPSSLASGLAEAFRSGQTPPFAEMAAQLFSNSGGNQQANMINTLLQSAGPAVLSRFLGNNAGSTLAGLLGGGQTQVSAEEAASIPPEEVQALAAHVEQHNPGIVDEISHVYSEHPTLIKTLGAVALGIALKRIAQNR